MLVAYYHNPDSQYTITLTESNVDRNYGYYLYIARKGKKHREEYIRFHSRAIQAFIEEIGIYL